MNTATKRASAIYAGSPWRTVLPVPDGTIGAGDRQAVAYLYAGITSAVVVPVVAEAAFIVPLVKRAFIVPSVKRAFVVPNPE